jgi:PPOX class probable FMN-dependent enzyme
MKFDSSNLGMAPRRDVANRNSDAYVQRLPATRAVSNLSQKGIIPAHTPIKGSTMDQTVSTIDSLEALEVIYGTPNDASTVKEVPELTPSYRRYIEAAPFAALATVGPEGLDCSPRGDRGHVVIIEDDKTLLLPERRGNNRIDSLRNIVRDPRIALLFLVPGSNTTLRVNGKATISVDPALLQRLAVDGHTPRSVTMIKIDAVYFQCARALIRSELWNEEAKADPKTLPTPGAMLAEVSNGTVGGEPYDRTWPERAAKTMW